MYSIFTIENTPNNGESQPWLPQKTHWVRVGNQSPVVSPQSSVGKDPGKQETTLVFKKMNKDLVTSQSNLIYSWTKTLTSPEQSRWETAQYVRGGQDTG